MPTSNASKYLLDTNVVLYCMRGKELGKWIQNKYELLSFDTSSFICAVTVGELYSIARRQGWKEKKQKRLKSIIDSFIVIPLELDNVYEYYAEIQFFTQSPSPQRTARPMGQNDLWIAAAARATELTLLTTDKDFDHLNQVLISLERIPIDAHLNG